MKATTEKLTTSFGQSVDVPLTGWALDKDQTAARGDVHQYFINENTGDRKITYGGLYLPYDMTWLAKTDGVGIVERALGTDIYTKDDLARELQYAKPKALSAG